MTDTWSCAGMTYTQAVETYANMVTRICAVRLGAVSDIDDCFQNVFLRLYLHPPQAETPENLKAWLITVTIRETVNRHRWLHADRQCSLEELPQAAAATDQNRELLQLLFTLPPKYREVLYLHYYEGYEVAELSRMLHRNQNTVKTHLSRGRALLRELLEDGDRDATTTPVVRKENEYEQARTRI